VAACRRKKSKFICSSFLSTNHTTSLVLLLRRDAITSALASDPLLLGHRAVGDGDAAHGCPEVAGWSPPVRDRTSPRTRRACRPRGQQLATRPRGVQQGHSRSEWIWVRTHFTWSASIRTAPRVAGEGFTRTHYIEACELAACLIGIEAGLVTHYVARELAALGHKVKQVPPGTHSRMARRNGADGPRNSR
jgi:hypothetical protein